MTKRGSTIDIAFDYRQPCADMNELILPLDHEDAVLARVGGKGASLAKLVQNGFPVPPGFHIPTEVYREFVKTTGLHEKIIGALAATAKDGGSFEALEKDVAAWFVKENISEDVTRAIVRSYEALGEGAAVAVRSSATAEDLPGMSFAGQQQSFLNVRGEAALLRAIKDCWASLWTARAIQYRVVNHVEHANVAMSVVVQLLVPADAAGILFTADPVSGNRNQVHINAGFGLGEAVVGGEVSPDTIVIDKSKMVIERQSISTKNVMTVRAKAGTQSVTVPEDKRNTAVLEAREAIELAKIGIAIEKRWGSPVDIEWARTNGAFQILQARPITGLPPDTSQLLTWNDSLAGDYLWTSANLGEAIPDVMTPCTWSIVQRFMVEAMFEQNIVGHPLYGNVGGRFYMNLSVMVGMAGSIGLSSKISEALEQIFGKLPPGVEMPMPKLPLWPLVKQLVPAGFKAQMGVRANLKNLQEFLKTAAKTAEDLRIRTEKAVDCNELVRLWNAEIEPHFRKSCQMLRAAGKQDSSALVKLRKHLCERVGETDANAVLTGLHAGGNELASLGPLIGLSKVARGEITREEFGRHYGHRGAHEFEISIPRPAELPDWIDKQLEGLRTAKDDLGSLLTKAEAERNAAWARVEKQLPKEIVKIKKGAERWAAVARDREFARSENMRCFWIARAFVVRAGEITGHGSDLFFLTIEEIVALLGGDASALPFVPRRRATYDAYASLPTYPTLIRGAFDPFAWARDPARRSDYFDASMPTVAATDAITGFPGAAGIVEGIVRVIGSPEEGNALQSGEILVTTVTNIGWTPIFPRAAAVVTDVGAPLSHAAIVSRELGIPAVVGCGNAMMRLHTGDRVRVDGARGVVELLTRAS